VQASAIAQTPSAAWWYSNTDIALMPRGDGHGRVGINTTTPGAALQVASYVQNSPNGYNYFKNHGGNDYELGYCAGCMANLSIDAEQNVLALEFDVQSDERIKNIVNTSDSGKDLDTINALQVTDYTLKDKAAHGNKPFKKVIAQQVETVYPQVVSKHVDFIPNVYQAASKVTKTDRGILLRFENGHHLTAQAKRIKLLASNEHTMQRVEIVSIPSERDVLIEATPLNGDKVFVYGEEVDDFRTVDYEGLTTLNISATQELSRQLTHQRADIAGIVTDEGAQLADLRQELANQTTRIVELERQTAEIVALKQERMAFQQQAAEITMLRQQMALVVELQEQAARLAAQTRLSSK
jgi:hypothetical protein